MKPTEAFGRALRSRRLDASLTQEKLGLEADLERVYISWLETGQKNPSLETILKLAGALKCKAAEIVAETEALLASEP